MNLTQYLDTIEKKLQSSFDLQRDYKIKNFHYDLFAKYHLRNERYILMKKATVYAMEHNEYSLIKFFDELNQDRLNTFFDALIESVDEVVNFSNDHMSSVITGVIIMDNKPSEDIIKTVERFKYHKEFAFGFKGWVDIRLLLVTLNEEFIITNKKGREVSKVYSV